MAVLTKKYKLKNILELRHYMKIAIDDSVETDDDGNFLINIAYLRVSTDRQADLGYGLDLQESAILNYCKCNNFNNLVLFIDDGYTGTNMERPALQGIISIIQDYNAGRSNIRINTMVIPRIDRLGRSLLGTLQFIQDYIVSKKDSKNSTINTNKSDINFISVAENYVRIDKDNPQSKFLLMLFATLAEYDRDLIVKKLKDGRRERVKSGKWLGGGITPYGYRYDKELSKLIVVPEEAENVREIFRLYIEEKMSPQKIADKLGFKGDRIITQILKRKSLTGCIVFNGEEFEGEHEAIIPLSRWEEAQDELEKRSVFRGDSHYLLSGLLYCGECGAKMRYQKWNKDGDCKIICYSTQKSKPNLIKDKNCESEKFWAYEIEDAVVKQIFDIEYFHKTDNRSKKTTSFVDPTESLNKELAQIKKKLNKLYDLIADDSDEEEVLLEKISTLIERKKNIQKALSDCEEKKKIERKLEKAKIMLREVKTSWIEMTPEAKQDVMQELIERIVVYKDGTINVYLKLRSYLQKNDI